MESWKPIPEYDGYYSISNTGRVRSESRVKIRSNGRPHTTKQKILNPTPDTGYLFTRIYHMSGERRNIWVHRMVCEAFNHKPKKGEDVDHIDGNKVNNHINNLRIIDHRDHSKVTIERIKKQAFDSGYKKGYSSARKSEPSFEDGYKSGLEEGYKKGQQANIIETYIAKRNPQ